MEITWLLLAAVIFIVAMAITVGPLLARKLVACAPAHSSESCCPGGLGWLAVLGAVLVAVLSVYGYRNTPPQQANATVQSLPPVDFLAPMTPSIAVDVVHEADVFVAEQSPPGPVMDPYPMSDAHYGHHPGHQVYEEHAFAGWLAPVLLIATVLLLASDRFRKGISSLLLVLAVGALLVMTFVTLRPVEEHRQVTIATAHDVVLPQGHDSDAVGRESLAMKPEPPPAPLTSHATKKKGDSKSATVTEYVALRDDGQARKSLPDWAKNPPQTGPVRVVRSGPHATVELAEKQALAELSRILGSEFIKRHPEASGWYPSPQTVRKSGSVLRRAIEQSEIQVGEFTSPMYEAYWQVDTSVDAPLYAAWRPRIIEQRLYLLGGGLALLTVLLATLAAAFRFDERTGGRRRRALAAGTVAVWALLGGAVLFVG